MVKLAKMPTATPTQDPTQALLTEEAYKPNEHDIIDDLLRIVLSMAPGFTAALAAQVDKEARARWGGDRPYIGTRSGRGSSARNANIKRDYLAGEHFHLLERRYGLSRSRLWEIIKS